MEAPPPDPDELPPTVPAEAAGPAEAAEPAEPAEPPMAAEPRDGARRWRLTDRRRAVLAAAIVGLPALALYMRTLLPDVSYWDTAEFQAIGPVLGIAHPTGYPAYTLLLWLASVALQPFGNPALRADMLSAVLVAAACATLAATMCVLSRRLVIGIGVGVIFALAPQTWAIALQADPHALHVFLAAVIVLLLVVWANHQRAGANADRFLVAAAAVFGVSLANHGLTVLLAPGIGLYVLIVYPRIFRRWRLIAACVAALVVTTVALYAYLPLRSAMNPPMDYADPQTWETFKYVVFAEQFQGTFKPRPELLDAIRQIATYNWQQLGLLLPLAAVGLLTGFVRRRGALVVLLVAWFALGWWFALGYENADIGRYYLVPLLCVAIVGGIGAAAILEGARALLVRVSLPRRSVARWAVAGLAAIVLVVPALAAAFVPGADHLNRMARLDESHDVGSRAWLTSLGAALPANSVLVSWWSFSTPLWYAQYVEGWRPDITVIDDRTMLDQHLGSAQDVLDSYLGKRPLYLIRVSRDLPRYRDRYVLAPVPGVQGEIVYSVQGYRQSAAGPNL